MVLCQEKEGFVTLADQDCHKFNVIWTVKNIGKRTNEDNVTNCQGEKKCLRKKRWRISWHLPKCVEYLTTVQKGLTCQFEWMLQNRYVPKELWLIQNSCPNGVWLIIITSACWHSPGGTLSWHLWLVHISKQTLHYPSLRAPIRKNHLYYFQFEVSHSLEVIPKISMQKVSESISAWGSGELLLGTVDHPDLDSLVIWWYKAEPFVYIYALSWPVKSPGVKEGLHFPVERISVHESG